MSPTLCLHSVKVSSLLRVPLVAASRRRHRRPGQGLLATRIPRQMPGSIRSAAQNTYRRDPTMPGGIGRQSPAAYGPQLLRNQIVMTRVISERCCGCRELLRRLFQNASRYEIHHSNNDDTDQRTGRLWRPKSVCANACNGYRTVNGISEMAPHLQVGEPTSPGARGQNRLP